MAEKTENESKTVEQEKVILLNQNKTISYSNTCCTINGKEQQAPTDKDTNFEKLAKEQLQLFYNTFFKKHFQNIVVLSAAGTSLDNGENKGKTREGLWKECIKEIEAFKGDVPNLENESFYKKYKKETEGKSEETDENQENSDNKEKTYGDIEELLSFLILYQKANKKDDEGFINKIKALEKKIADNCKLVLDKNAPHQKFLSKITARKPSDSRVHLFTTNYDTLFEQAANKAGFIIIDGFSYTQPRVFSGRYFDYDFVNREKTRLKNEENFIPRVFHLYKLHGSLSWRKESINGKDKIIQEDQESILKEGSGKDPLIVYPASNKYESSYEQPYFEMMSRFQQALRKENVLLIVIGFGFKDKHIQNAIFEAVEQNPSFQLVVVDYNGEGTINKNNLKDLFEDNELTRIKRNVTIIFDKFKDFTDKYPENETYKEEFEGIQPNGAE
ncbi:MAG: SIR2 family protein [Bacteroidales bacterium]|nr:SIR2 family protein [Bacteroidales bacterium]